MALNSILAFHFEIKFLSQKGKSVFGGHGVLFSLILLLFLWLIHSISMASIHFSTPLSAENPYKCLTCSYSAISISQLKEHSLRAHGEMLTLPKLRAGAALRSLRPSLSGDPMTLTQEGEGKRQRGKSMSFSLLPVWMCTSSTVMPLVKPLVRL